MLSFWVVAILRYLFFNFFEFLKKKISNFLTIFFFKMFVFGQGIQWAKNFEPKMFSLQLLWTKLNIISKNFKKRRENCNFKTNNFSSKSFSSLNSLEKNKHFEKKICQKIQIFFFKNSKKLKNNYLKITITQKLRVGDP